MVSRLFVALRIILADFRFPAVFVVALLISGTSALYAQPAGTSGTAGDDYTDRLRMSPGMQIVFPVKDGIDTHWKKLGDYDFTAVIEGKSRYAAFGYRWTMSDPVNTAGYRSIPSEDVHDARKVSLFYEDKQHGALDGFMNIVRISDSLYQDLKNHVKSDFELDGPDSVKVNHAEEHPLPHSIEAIGEEPQQITLNGKDVTVRTIEAQADNGWRYWVLDNPKLPLIVKGDGPFRWEKPSLTVALLDGQQPPKQQQEQHGKKEGKRIVDQLKHTGVATTHAILFDFDSSKIKPQSIPILDEVAKYLGQEPSTNLAIEGHTDSVGTKEYNLKLSMRRANAVRVYLLKKGSVQPARLKASGFGFSKPVATNKTAAGRAQNRRVVFRKF
jgi:outer membrane protein OmpA-like peptidoglycan-associated protein